MGNRNAASHLWSSFLLQRSQQMTPERLETLFTGFCAVSGSPVSPSPHSRYKMVLDRVDGRQVTGYTYYCYWPCVCDTQDFIRVDTLTVPTAHGPKQYQFLVIGDPCLDPKGTIPYQAPELPNSISAGQISPDPPRVTILLMPATSRKISPMPELYPSSALRLQ